MGTWSRGGACMLALCGGALLAHLTPPVADVKAHRRLHEASEPSPLLARMAPQGETPWAAAGSQAEPVPVPDPAELGGRRGLAEELRDGRVITGATQHRLILFSFDDGPDRRTTPLLLDRLDAEGIKAVFFLTGSRLLSRNMMEREQAMLAREIVRRGHIAASHTLDHAQLPLLTDAAALDQLVATERVFQRLLGGRPWLIRPPGGARSPRIDRLLAGRGYTTVMWNLGTGDFQVRSAEEVHATWRRVLERREREHGERGGIILLHDTYPWSVDAFQRIVADLWDRNCTLLAQGEELYDIVDDPSFFFEPRGEAGPSEFAGPARLDPDVLEARQARLRVVAAKRCRRIATL